MHPPVHKVSKHSRDEMLKAHDERKTMTISPEAKEAARIECLAFQHPDIYDTHELGYYVQLAINSATAPLHKEIERLRGEVEKAYQEGFITARPDEHCGVAWTNSRARRVAEGKE